MKKYLIVLLLLTTACKIEGRLKTGVSVKSSETYDKNGKIFVKFEDGSQDTLTIPRIDLYRLKLTEDGNVTNFKYPSADGTIYARNVLYFKEISK